MPVFFLCSTNFIGGIPLYSSPSFSMLTVAILPPLRVFILGSSILIVTVFEPIATLSLSFSTPSNVISGLVLSDTKFFEVFFHSVLFPALSTILYSSDDTLSGAISNFALTVPSFKTSILSEPLSVLISVLVPPSLKTNFSMPEPLSIADTPILILPFEVTRSSTLSNVSPLQVTFTTSGGTVSIFTSTPFLSFSIDSSLLRFPKTSFL